MFTVKKSLLVFVILVTTIFGVNNQAESSPHNIVLFVPLNGDLADSGQAIQNGFLAAYYYAQQNNKIDTAVKIVDTSQGNIMSLYKKAVADGADFIVGPLTKNDTKVLTHKHSLPVTTLALNTVDDYQSNKVENLYQFGLSAQDEALQMTNQAWHKNPGRALIIVPDTLWGNNMLSVIKSRWQELGGEAVATLSYSNTNLMQQVQHVLNADLSLNTAKTIQSGLKQNVNFITHRRQDIDVILLVAFPNEARQIKPLLNFYYAEDVPVYATSAIYSGVNQPDLDGDLDGIMFCDIPWVISPSLGNTLQQLKDQVIKTWPDSYSANSRLYALGIDALFMALSFDRLTSAPGSGIPSATGTLYVDPYNHIYRQLPWAKMTHGVPVILTDEKS